jgi:hypothetical protein
MGASAIQAYAAGPCRVARQLGRSHETGAPIAKSLPQGCDRALDQPAQFLGFSYNAISSSDLLLRVQDRFSSPLVLRTGLSAPSPAW